MAVYRDLIVLLIFDLNTICSNLSIITIRIFRSTWCPILYWIEVYFWTVFNPTYIHCFWMTIFVFRTTKFSFSYIWNPNFWSYLKPVFSFSFICAPTHADRPKLHLTTHVDRRNFWFSYVWNPNYWSDSKPVLSFSLICSPTDGNRHEIYLTTHNGENFHFHTFEIRIFEVI